MAGWDKIQTIYQCDSNGRENHTVVADMDGTLLVGSNSFAYFALIAFDVGGILRLLLLLLAAPFAAFLYHFVSESAGIKVLIFATFAGVKLSSISSAASAVLPKHYSEDLHPETWRVFASCGTKYVLTANPNIMVEPFLKNYLGVDVVLGTEISSFKGIATGLVARGVVLVGENKVVALKNAFGDQEMPNIGIGDRDTDIPFIKLCKEKYIVPRRAGTRPVRPETLPKPVIFHDGRLVQTPTFGRALVIIMWFPIGITLAILRVFCISVFPISTTYYMMNLFGCPITIKRGPKSSYGGGKGVLFVSNHRTVVDAAIISATLGQMTTAVTYSVAGFTEFISPIKTARFTRDRATDARLMEKILEGGELLVMSPEGTTCREPYLLRFSALFAELTDRIVPVALDLKTNMFHGSTARGRKWLDTFFLYMNPFPAYEITFLDMLPADRTCKAGKSSFDVANSIQEMIGEALGFKCTNLTRRDKYRVLAGTDGLVGQKPTNSLID